MLPPATSPTPVHEVVIDGEVLAPAPKTEPMPSTPVTPPTSGHNVTIDADPNEVTNPTPNTMLATVAYVDAQNQVQDAAIATKADQSALNDLSQTVDAKADQVTLDALNEKVTQIDVAKATKQSVSAATTRIKEIQTQLTTLSEQMDAKADATTVNDLTEAVNTKASKEEVSAALTQVAAHAEGYADRVVRDMKVDIDKAQQAISRLDTQVGALDNKVTELSGRMDVLEKDFESGMAANAALSGLFQP